MGFSDVGRSTDLRSLFDDMRLDSSDVADMKIQSQSLFSKLISALCGTISFC